MRFVVSDGASSWTQNGIVSSSAPDRVRNSCPCRRPAHSGDEWPGQLRADNGLRVLRPPKRLKSRSALSNSRTP